MSSPIMNDPIEAKASTHPGFDVIGLPMTAI